MTFVIDQRAQHSALTCCVARAISSSARGLLSYGCGLYGGTITRNETSGQH